MTAASDWPARTPNWAESTVCVSDVVETLARLSVPWKGGLVMPLKVIATLWPAPIVLDENSEHWITRPLGLPQLPTLVAVVRLRTVALA